MSNNRKDELLQIAYKMFITKGYDNTSVDQIIKEANIAKGTYYYYFTSKEEMLDQVIEKMITEKIELAKKIVTENLTVERKLLGIISSLRPAYNESSIIDALNNEGNIKMHKKVNERILDSAIPILKEVVQEGNEKKIFKCDKIEKRIRIILILSTELFDNNEFDQDYIEIFIDTIEKVLGAKKDSMKFIIKLIGGYNE